MYCYINKFYLSFLNNGQLFSRCQVLKSTTRCTACAKIHGIATQEKNKFHTRPKIAFNCNDFMYSHHSFSIWKGILDISSKGSCIVVLSPSRSFHANAFLLQKDETSKPSSQVEVTVKDLKEKAKSNGSSPTKPLPATTRKSLAVRIKEEILHYYHGFKLLFIDFKISSKYIYRLMNGETLSRREHHQLIRTTGDLFRLVPFSVFIIVPFMEFLLPVALKLFPGMLPSTFETSNEKEAKMKKKLKVKLEMAKFLQETLDSMSVEAKGHYSQSAKEFVEFFEKTHRTGEHISNEEIMKFSKLFEDEITLDSLSRPQLMALCRLLEMQPFGTNNFLRFQLRMKLRNLAADDKIIQHEGIESLAVWELQQACRSRGMRAFGMSKERLRVQLKQWLDLSLNEKVPPSLLLLSRTLFVPSDVPHEESLAATISTLPDEVATLTKASIGKREGKIDNVTRFKVIKSEEKKIQEDQMEEMEEKKRKELARKKEEHDLQVAAAEEFANSILQSKIPESVEVPSPKTLIAELAASQPAQLDKDTLIDAAPVQVDKAPEAAAAPKEEHIEITAEDIDHVEEALEMMEIEKKSHFIEETELSGLKSEMADYEEDIKDFKEALGNAAIKESAMKESKAARHLYARVNKMITKMEPLMATLNEQKESLQMRLQETRQPKDDSSSTPGQEDERDELIDIEELVKHMECVISTPDSAKLEMIKKVLEKMDDDMDGAVKAEDVLKVLDLISKDNVSSMSAKLFGEIIETMAKEEQLESKTLLEVAFQLPKKPPPPQNGGHPPPPPQNGEHPPPPPTEDIQKKIQDLSSKEGQPSKGVKTNP